MVTVFSGASPLEPGATNAQRPPSHSSLASHAAAQLCAAASGLDASELEARDSVDWLQPQHGDRQAVVSDAECS